MKVPGLDYKAMVEESLRGVVREALSQVAAHGLPGDHHFYITFRTAFPGVEIPEYLQKRFPAEMTIVLQHQFDFLEVEPTGFSVTLKFTNVPERLVIPFLAITMFADPSVNFALPFQPPELPPAAQVETLKPAAAKAVEPRPAEPPAADSGEKSGEVVSLDKFRKK